MQKCLLFTVRDDNTSYTSVYVYFNIHKILSVQLHNKNNAMYATMLLTVRDIIYKMLLFTVQDDNASVSV